MKINFQNHFPHRRSSPERIDEQDDRESQLLWIEGKLRHYNNIADYIFVIGHHPTLYCKPESSTGEEQKDMKKAMSASSSNNGGSHSSSSSSATFDSSKRASSSDSSVMDWVMLSNDGGTSDVDLGMNSLDHLFDKYRVTAYIFGHMHHLGISSVKRKTHQVLQRRGRSSTPSTEAAAGAHQHKTYHILSGAGSKPKNNVCTHPNDVDNSEMMADWKQKILWEQGGVAGVAKGRISQKGLRFEFWETSTNEMLYRSDYIPSRI